MIKPTVGRVVWYRMEETSIIPHRNGAPLAAIIAAVNSDSLINLTVFDSCGVAWGMIDVPLVQDGEPAPLTGGYAEWMPFQKGQAAKTEAAEALATK